MSMLHTFQSAYVPLRSAEVTSDDTPIDGTTAWDLTSKDCYELDPAYNGICIMFAGEMTDGAQTTCHIHGQSINGPAEKIAEISLTAGTVYFKGRVPKGTTDIDSTTYLHIDTIAADTTNDFHIRDTDYFDSGNNRVAKFKFDTTGLKFLLCEFTQVAGANEPTRITPYARFW